MEELTGFSLLIDYLFRVSPVVGVLGWWIHWLMQQLKAARQEIKEQNEYSRQQDKENLKVMNDLITVTDRLLSEGKELNSKTVEAIKEQAEKTIDRITNHINKVL